ncbi:hypothetical protein HOY82DRAFT_570923, partial [Tuber indicum]
IITLYPLCLSLQFAHHSVSTFLFVWYDKKRVIYLSIINRIPPLFVSSVSSIQEIPFPFFLYFISGSLAHYPQYD